MMVQDRKERSRVTPLRIQEDGIKCTNRKKPKTYKEVRILSSSLVIGGEIDCMSEDTSAWGNVG